MPSFAQGPHYDDGTGSAQINRVHIFVRTVNQEQDAQGQRFYFRGDGEQLLPHIGKPWHYGNAGPTTLTSDQEWQLLHRFHRFTYPEVRTDSADWETLFLARHHGLPTRLLDWSTNPLFALYFALGLRPGNTPPGPLIRKYVWAIMLRPAGERADIDVLASGSRPLKQANISVVRENGARGWMAPNHDAIKIVFPVYNSARITAQRGVFTWQSDPWTPIEDYVGVNLPSRNLDVARLYRWSIAPSMAIRTRLVRELLRVGVDAKAIHPELDGICNSLLHTQLLFP